MPVLPIQSIEAPAFGGGGGMGPPFMNKILKFDFGKKNRNQTNTIIFPESYKNYFTYAGKKPCFTFFSVLKYLD